MNNQSRLNILLLYDQNSTFTNTVREYLESFSLFSHHHIYYAHATNNAKCKFDLELFDVVIIHYSVRLSLDYHISPFYAEEVQKFDGLKLLFIQDEYDNTEVARNWINKLGINVVFSCVPQNYIEQIYPKSRFNNVDFISTLTGFFPIHLQNKNNFKPLSERKFIIGYRGRELAYWYGNLAREKLIIGQKMRAICQQRGILADIEWEEDKRIYGDKWYDFLENCRVTLGTESGSNVFDDYGEIRKNIEISLRKNPLADYEKLYTEYVARYEKQLIMNQISPKIFESIALKTGLVLFEGKYSGVIQPDVHYIPLKKDFSNIDEVLQKVMDDDYLERMTERAYTDIVKSGKYTYKSFVNFVDDVISKKNIISKNKSGLCIQKNDAFNSKIEKLEHEIQSLQLSLENFQNTIAGMESSKFWKLRTKWLEMKKVFGLGNDVG